MTFFNKKKKNEIPVDCNERTFIWFTEKSRELLNRESMLMNLTKENQKLNEELQIKDKLLQNIQSKILPLNLPILMKLFGFYFGKI